jgi:hypothetical protein
MTKEAFLAGATDGVLAAGGRVVNVVSSPPI